MFFMNLNLLIFQVKFITYISEARFNFFKRDIFESVNI